LRTEVEESVLTPVEHQTFLPYKGLGSYYDIGDARLPAWSNPGTYTEVTVIPHGPDRDLDVPAATGKPA
jgi:uncharacterized protein (DUF427 family)